MTERRADDALARKRYFTIATMRLIGALLIVLAIMTLRDITGLHEFFGYGLLILGIVGMLVIPQIMVRQWRSPKRETLK